MNPAFERNKRPRKHPLLRKWARQRFYWELRVRVAVAKMDLRQRKALRRAVEVRTTTNCWFGEYELLPFLKKLLDDRDQTYRNKAELKKRIKEANKK